MYSRVGQGLKRLYLTTSDKGLRMKPSGHSNEGFFLSMRAVIFFFLGKRYFEALSMLKRAIAAAKT